nr:hypothetical protein BaRGS_014732 [Batillaria attramentaria]
MTGNCKDDDDVSEWRRVFSLLYSLGYEARMREVKKINDENRRMLDRILATCTSYDHIKMELEYQARSISLPCTV